MLQESATEAKDPYASEGQDLGRASGHSTEISSRMLRKCELHKGVYTEMRAESQGRV